MLKRVILVMLAALVLPTLAPVAAQEAFTEEEQAMIALVAAAYENFYTVESYNSVATQTITQDIESGSGLGAVSFTQTIEQEVSGATEQTDGVVTAMFITSTQNVGMSGLPGANTDIALNFEMALVDGQIYVRYVNLPPELAFSGLPDEWTPAQQVPGMEMLAPDNLSSIMGASSFAAFPVNEENLVSISEGEPETLDGQTLRVFTFAWSNSALAEIIPQIQGAAFDPRSMGLDVSYDEFMEDYLKNLTMEQTVWVNEADGLIYRIDVAMTANITMSVSGTEVALDQEILSSTSFSDFNEPLTIEVPDFNQ